MATANKLTLPVYKSLVSEIEEIEESIAQLSRAATGARPILRIPPTILATCRTFPKLVQWIKANKVNYEKAVAMIENGATTDAPRARAAGRD
jgi:hypothetical protein